MKLSKPDADLYFELMWSLQFFVNRQLGLLPNVPTVSAYRSLTTEEKMQVREALYDKPELIDTYLQENPDQFSADKLAMVSQWKHFVRGEFYIERFLKKYTVFIGGETVYGVLGLYDGFEEMIHKSYLPMYARAVLLPFLTSGRGAGPSLGTATRMKTRRGRPTCLPAWATTRDRPYVNRLFSEQPAWQKQPSRSAFGDLITLPDCLASLVHIAISHQRQ